MGSIVTVLGGGSWGTALALQLARVGHEVVLWARSAEVAAAMASARENVTYLPGVPLPPNVDPTSDLAAACAQASMVVFVCPSGGVRELAQAVAPLVREGTLVVSAAKGVEQDSRQTMSAVLEEVI